MSLLEKLKSGQIWTEILSGITVNFESKPSFQV
jgi:hypothetical protein